MVLARIKKQGGVCVGYEMERVVLGRVIRQIFIIKVSFEQNPEIRW